ncbi:MAG: hypothetical protein AABY32_00120 [Nanoarchaeota archaeon]|mgnify:FL=1
MTEEKNNLVKKIGWAYTIRDFLPSGMQYISICQKLEDKGFGMLADKLDCEKIDGYDSVVFPDGKVLTSEQIISYWEESNIKFNPKDSENLRMYQAYLYLLGFKEQLNSSLILL